ncbi:MAG: hypothetical protein JKY54_06845 [Flavobacteriales bacterium]|nr:hypothetical protein [Flavobacteriales bacterium]
MIAPNNYLLSYEGEAARVYYVLASHAKTDSTYVNFQGMNYPYGENVIFCDGQPLLTNGFKAVAEIFSAVTDYAVGVQNFISLYAFIVGALLLYIFLIQWKIPPWYASLAAFVIMLIGPQVVRLPWHPALSYAFFIPLLLVLYQQYFRNRHWKVTIFIFVVNTCAFFINVYLGIMGVGLFGIVAMILLYKERWKSIKPYLQSAVQTLLPAMLFLSYQAISDGRLDRVNTPTGVLDFTSTLGTIFSSPYSPLTPFYDFIGIDSNQTLMHWEGMSYVGMACNLLILFFVLRFMIRWVKRKPLWVFMDREKKLLMIVAVSFLVMAMGIPFVLTDSFNGLLDLITPLKQLRGWGRMAWMFTFCINVIMMYLLYRLLNGKGKVKWKKITGIGVAVMLLLFQGYEGTYLHVEAHTKQVKGNPFVLGKLTENKLVGHLEEALSKVNPDDYSALVPIPYFHWGSELFLTPTSSSYRAELEAFTFAYHTGLPMTACFTSRNSRMESINAFQFFAPSMIEKQIAKDIPSDKPLLIFYSRHVSNALSEDEQRILNLGEVVYESVMFRLISVQPDQIWKTNSEQIYSWLIDYKDQYTQIGKVWYFGETPPVYLSYNDEQKVVAMNGGALSSKENDRQFIFDQQKDAPNLNAGTYELSFWFENSKNRSQAHLVMETVDASGNLIAEVDLWNAKRTAGFVGNWMRWHHPVEIIEGQFVRFYIVQPFNKPGWVVDELLLQAPGSPVYVNTDKNNWYWNNYPLTLTTNDTLTH